ncbi:MAG: chromate efflux transporter [Cyclobacteriaceae bacterium]|nr:chromate efflux transporter [Cyclobacteriaceae bacterium]
MVKRIRYFIFLRDVFIIAIGAFGGPTSHLAMIIKRMVVQRAYLSEAELMELNALCQILPGPTSTQTITAIGFKIGGPLLAYLTLMVWLLPAFCVMTTVGVLMSHFDQVGKSVEFTKFIQPMAVGFVAYAAYVISTKVVKSYEAGAIMMISAILSFMLKSPYVFPVLLLGSGALTAIKFTEQPIEPHSRLKIEWSNFVLWAVVFVAIAVVGHFTKALPIRLLENFYRNGSLIFGGGQVLIPLLYTEFVEFKHYLTSEEFLTGYAAVQAVPGPVFSFASYIGALSMREYGLWGEILGALLATIGVFLPGTFFIFFVIRFWEQLKKYRIVRASIEGINAASSGMVIAAAFLLFQPLEPDFINMAMIIATFLALTFTKIPPPFIILSGLLAGFALTYF